MSTLTDAVVKATELRVGDVVHLFDGPYSTANVSKIEHGEIHFVRPYVCQRADSETPETCEIGVEKFSRPVTDKAMFHLLYRPINYLKGAPVS